MKLKINLRTFNNATYSPGKNGFFKVIWFVFGRALVNTYLPIPQFIKIFLLKLFGANIGAGVVIKPKVNIKYPWLLSVGENTWIGEQVWIDNLVLVKIESNCCLSQGAMLLTGNHNYKKSSFDLITGEIVIKEGAWIGAKATVCPGVTLATHSIASVGTVITKNTEPYCIYAGNPAVKVRDRIIEQ